MAEQNADYIVIGGGTAGCVVASRLHQYRPELSILLVEAGPNEHSNPLITLPINCPRIRNTPLAWNYNTSPQKHLNNRQLYNCAGKLLSGSSAINYGSWTRGPKVDYDLWAEAVGDQRWSYEGMLPYFKRTETHNNPDDNKEQHGFEGPIHTDKGRTYPIRQAVKSAFEGIGLKEVEDANGGDPRGLTMWTENFYEGKRQPAGVAYDLSGVKVLTRALVRRVLIEEVDEGMSATGVELVDGRRFMAGKEVIVSCGALRTPQVLMLSGIGPAEQLEKIGIEQLVSSPEVGRNFWDHCAMMQYWKLRSPSQGLSVGSPLFNAPEYSHGMPFEWLVTSSTPSEILKPALLLDNENSPTHPVLHRARCHYEMTFGYAILGRGTELGIPVDGTHISSAVLNLAPTSRGTITLSSASPADDPTIDPNYNATHTDRAILRHAMRRLMAATETSAAAAVIERETPPPGLSGLSSQSGDEELDERIRAHASTMYHPAGSAAMGKVVDADLRVMGVRGLRVCDASVFPVAVAVAGHTQCAVYAVAERGAEIIAGVGVV